MNRVEVPNKIYHGICEKDSDTNIHCVFRALLQVKPIEVRALKSYEEEGRLHVEEGDLITVLEGRYVRTRQIHFLLLFLIPDKLAFSV